MNAPLIVLKAVSSLSVAILTILNEDELSPTERVDVVMKIATTLPPPVTLPAMAVFELGKQIAEMLKKARTESMDDKEIIIRLTAACIGILEITLPTIKKKQSGDEKTPIDTDRTYTKLLLIFEDPKTGTLDALESLEEHIIKMGNPFGDDLTLFTELKRYIYTRRQLNVPDEIIQQEVLNKLRIDQAALQQKGNTTH